MNNEKTNFIYINAFFNGFIDKTDCNNVGFFEKLFCKTNLNNFEFTNDLNTANILLESCFGNSIVDIKKWEKTIFFSGESTSRFPRQLNKYDIILKGSYNNNKIIDLPLFVVYITNNNLLNRIIQEKNIVNVPKKFCCFCVSNGNSFPRNKMFTVLNSYKKVDSLGHYNNNVGYFIDIPYWSEDYLNYLKEYKFIICFENSKEETYITEKIINAYVSNVIPIYWGTDHVKNIFYEDSMIYLNNENNEQSYNDVLNKVIELDNDDSKYLEFINRKTLKFDYFEENYTIDKIAKKINHLL
jgi:hypothetical protein